ncbi:hypothetical protein HMPREF0602_0704 [Neisseria meningitidis ATCC 13091]|uniref:Uncharacterized protein n=1 Tax=Neisseria meningitidis serogroup B (strain ATCC 13091 / M2091) TaxID=862513 RepID=E0N874_NEIM3|nr:hypothetical protein HMPREF0602_0704 [Neisseria meningitidis ATCC 13091]
MEWIGVVFTVGLLSERGYWGFVCAFLIFVSGIQTVSIVD